MKRFEIIGTTADAGFVAYGESLEALFTHAAAAMFAIIFGQELQVPDPDIADTFTLSAVDIESLLVDFLSELLWRFDTDLLVPATMNLSIRTPGGPPREPGGGGGPERARPMLEARAGFAPLERLAQRPVTDVKAVTMHNLAIVRDGGVFSVKVILDI
ncbi:MAG: hypothetical protein DRH70_01660 [Candidatus Coatesbacteria bacterium]|nr:MAG: hypothetical protein DRH70_01660 [Candidatus Coatesbacteria bacterium]